MRKLQRLTDEIKLCDPAEEDAIWAILKCRSYGIFRKIPAMCAVFCIDPQESLDQAPINGEDRVIDHESRALIHDALMELKQTNRENE